MVLLKNVYAVTVFFILLQCALTFAAPNTLNSSSALAPAPAPSDPRIINGTLADVKTTMHQVSIRRRLFDSYFFGTGHICGGTLISPTVVLSAAHCFVDYDSEDNRYITSRNFIVVMGNLDRFVYNNNTLVYDVTHIVYGTPNFNLTTFESDIALLFLNASVPTYHPTVQPILINRKSLPDGIECQVTGWGTTEDGYLSDLLMTVDVPIIPNNICTVDTDFGPNDILDGMICAGYLEGERDACSGDSGGPLVCNGLLAGIVSWGIGCAQPNLPGVYTDVEFYAPWLDAQVKAAGGSLAGSAAFSIKSSFMMLVSLTAIALSLSLFFEKQ